MAKKSSDSLLSSGWPLSSGEQETRRGGQDPLPSAAHGCGLDQLLRAAPTVLRAATREGGRSVLRRTDEGRPG